MGVEVKIFAFLFCLLVIDPCGVNPCRNGGTCTAVMNEFRCICPVGYKGDRCEGENSYALDRSLFIRVCYIESGYVHPLLAR